MAEVVAALREGAELAAVSADVGVVDVAVDDVGDGVADAARAQRVGRAADGCEVVAARREQRDDVGLRRAGRRRRRGRGRRRSSAKVAASVRAQAAPRQVAAKRLDASPGAQASSRARPAVSMWRSTACAQRRGRASALGPQREWRAGCASRSTSVRPAAARSRARAREVRPGRLGVDVVGRHRRDAAPVVDAGADRAAPSSPGCRLGGAWMFIAGPRIRRATAMVQTCSSSAGSAAAAMRVPGLARKFWMMISWMWPCALVDVADRQQRLDALGPRLADADQDAGGERHAGAAGGVQRGEAHGRHLVGRAEMRAAALATGGRTRSPA